jgi:aspartate carbamoyltransferase catalytic subunit
MDNLISMRNMPADDILAILDVAARLEANPGSADLSGKVMANVFYEPSTRTQLSFESAMKKLGGEVITMQGTRGTSVEKGETLADTVSILAQYADIIVMRHSLEGAARFVAEVVNIPVVNAGDGANQHPTQCLLDLYSIRKTQGTLENLHVAMAGDLKYGRTVHSLVFGLAPFKPTLHFISPPNLRMPSRIKEELQGAGIAFTESEELDATLMHMDILYMTRIQRERFPDPEEIQQSQKCLSVAESSFTGGEREFQNSASFTAGKRNPR